MKRFFVILLVLLIAVGGGCYLYVSDYYKADDVAIQAMADENTSITTMNNLTVVAPQTPSQTGLIFYPGGKVEEMAYLPLLIQLSQNGITCILIQMRFDWQYWMPMRPVMC